ncbi:MAG: 50S ribosomal protein L4 [Candidatus Paceibacterota bacterium]|jgi:large subunit ribosomal protein L4
MEKAKTQKNKAVASVKKVRPALDMNAKVYGQDGKDKGTIELPKGVFAVKWNNDLVHQVMLSMQSNARAGTAHTKSRGEVRGGGRKPWAQKGTGRARHGSSRSPIWRGGGVTFGPRAEKNYDRKINKKMKAKALYAVLSKKFTDGEIIFIDTLKLGAPKTKDAKAIFDKIIVGAKLTKTTMKKRNTAYLALGAKDVEVEKSFRNLPNLETGNIRDLNLLSLLNHRYIMISEPKESVSFLEAKIK